MKKSTICPVCGKEVRPRYGNERESIYCSRACFLTVRKVPKESRKCLICGKEFTVKVTSLQQCCSKPCAAIRIGLLQRGKKVTSPAFYEARRKSGVTGPRKHPVTGKFETNCHAKIWHLQSPEGEEIVVRNLRLYMCNRYGEKEGLRVAARLVCLAMRWKSRKKTTGKAAGWKLLSLPVLPEERKGALR